jgi:hypothetical protein
VKEHPDVTLANLRQRWLFSAQNFPDPETAAEFLRQTHDLLYEWYERWHTLWKKVHPEALGGREAKIAWAREQDLKALAVWHALRDMRSYWHECGLWEGNPYDANDMGIFTVGPIRLPYKAEKPAKRKRT